MFVGVLISLVWCYFYVEAFPELVTMTIPKTRKSNVLHCGLLPYNGSLLATFGCHFLGISVLKRRIYCWIATLNTIKPTPQKRQSES